MKKISIIHILSLIIIPFTQLSSTGKVYLVLGSDTAIWDGLGVSKQVELIIYDILGKEVEHLVDEYQNSGKYSIQWNSNTMCSGLYIYVLKTDFKTFSKKMILMK